MYNLLLHVAITPVFHDI